MDTTTDITVTTVTRNDSGAADIWVLQVDSARADGRWSGRWTVVVTDDPGTERVVTPGGSILPVPEQPGPLMAALVAHIVGEAA